MVFAITPVGCCVPLLAAGCARLCRKSGCGHLVSIGELQNPAMFQNMLRLGQIKGRAQSRIPAWLRRPPWERRPHPRHASGISASCGFTPTKYISDRSLRTEAVGVLPSAPRSALLHVRLPVRRSPFAIHIIKWRENHECDMWHVTSFDGSVCCIVQRCA